MTDQPKPRVISIDFETFFSKACSVKTLGAWAYTHHPDYYCYLMSVCDGEETWVGEPQDFDWSTLEGAHLVSHNAMFDRTVYETGVETDQWPRVEFAQWDCTANLSAYLCNRRSLKDAALFLLGVELDKGARTVMKNKHWKDVRDTEQGKVFKEYAASDALNCWKIWNQFSDRWPEFERELSRLTIDQGMYGVQIDVLKLEHYLKESNMLLLEIEKRLPWVEAEGAKPTSTKAIATACRTAGIPNPPVKSHEGGEEAYVKWEDTYKGRFTWVNAAVQWRSLNKFIGTLETLKSRLRPDGTFSFGLKYFGAHTGRWAGDAGVNMQNLKSVPILVDDERNVRLDEASSNEYLNLKEDGRSPEWLRLTFDIRSLFIARPGKKFVLCDLAQIEPRVLAWLSGHTRLLEAIRDGYGVYEAAAIATGKYAGEKGGFKKLKALYKAQKAQTLSLGYGSGWERYIETAHNMAGYDVCVNDRTNEKTGKKIYGSAARDEVIAYRKENPEITGLWAKLDAGFRESLEGDFIMELPTGRAMTYRDVSRRRKMKRRDILNEETGEVLETKIEERWVYTAEVDGRRYEFYGGALTENITQSLAREVFGYLMLKVLEAGFCVLWSVHDEVIVEVNAGDAGTDMLTIEQLMSETPSWLPGCPIGSEAKVSDCYLK